MPHTEVLTIDAEGLRRAIDEAISAHINGLAPHLPPIMWSRELIGPAKYAGMVTDEHDDKAAVAEQWAQLLGLTEEDLRPSWGTRSWVGPAVVDTVFEPVDVHVWYVADRDVFEAR